MNAHSPISTVGTDLLERARSFVPELRAARAEIDAQGRTPSGLAARLKAAGLYSMTVPTAYGGAQANLSTWRQVVTEIGKGDAGVAWGVSLINSANWAVAALFSRHVVDQVFATADDGVAGVLSPRGVVARRVEGGMQVEKGMWFFNSGVYQATWDLLGIPLFNDAGEPVGVGAALVPIAEVQLLDDWDSSGLRGSGSTNVAMKDVFIPQERIIDLRASLFGARTGAFGHEALYQGAFLAFPVLRAGMHMLEAFLAKLPKRDIKNTIYTKAGEAAITHVQLGQATFKLDVAALVIKTVCDAIDAASERGETMDFAERARLCRDVASADKLVWEAAEILADASGGTFSHNGNVLNRIWQDIKVGCAHPMVAPTSHYENYGRSLCGVEPPLMVV